MHPIAWFHIIYTTMFIRKEVHICCGRARLKHKHRSVCMLIDFLTILRSICVNVWNVLATHNYGDTLRSHTFFSSFLFMFFSYSQFVAKKSAKESLKKCNKKCCMYERTQRTQSEIKEGNWCQPKRASKYRFIKKRRQITHLRLM